MKIILKDLKPLRKSCVLGPLFKFCEAILELFVPIIVASIIDTGIPKSDNAYIFSRAGVLLLLALVGFGFSIIGQYYSANAAIGFATNIRKRLFSHINKLSYKQLDSVGSATLITRLTSDINQIQTGVNLLLRLVLRSPLVVFGALIMAIILCPRMAVIFAVTVILLYVVVLGIMFTTVPMYKKVQQKLDKVTNITMDNLTGARVIRAFCKEEDEKRIFNTATENLTKSQQHVGKISAVMDPISYVIINFGIIAIVYFGGINVKSGIISTGVVVALYNYMSQILIEIIKFGKVIINLTKAVASAKRIEAVLTIEPENLSGNTDVEKINSIEFEDVSFGYNGNKTVLDNISFKAHSGETIGIIGGTGSGKTTLVNLICKYYLPNGGKVLINGTDITDITPQSLGKRVSTVPQNAVLFAGSIKKNLLWGNKDATDRDIDLALKTANAYDFVMQKEGGTEFCLEQGAKNLSGGQRQRLTIARAVIKRGDVLILDDSFSALDYATDLSLRQNLKKDLGESIVFIVSQRASSVINADKIIVMENGFAVGIGTHAELLQNCETYREIYYSQYERQEN